MLGIRWGRFCCVPFFVVSMKPSFGGAESVDLPHYTVSIQVIMAMFLSKLQELKGWVGGEFFGFLLMADF